MHLTARFNTASHTLHLAQTAAEGALHFISSHHTCPSLSSETWEKKLEPFQAEIQIRNSLNSPLYQIFSPFPLPHNPH